MELRLTMRSRKVFQYPPFQSVPPLPLVAVDRTCPCCPSLGFVASCAVLVPCGCLFHPPCLAARFQSNTLTCPRYRTSFDPSYLAQFDVPLDAVLQREVEWMKFKLKLTGVGEPCSDRPPPPPGNVLWPTSSLGFDIQVHLHCIISGLLR